MEWMVLMIMVMVQMIYVALWISYSTYLVRLLIIRILELVIIMNGGVLGLTAHTVESLIWIVLWCVELWQHLPFSFILNGWEVIITLIVSVTMIVNILVWEIILWFVKWSFSWWMLIIRIISSSFRSLVLISLDYTSQSVYISILYHTVLAMMKQSSRTNILFIKEFWWILIHILQSKIKLRIISILAKVLS